MTSAHTLNHATFEKLHELLGDAVKDATACYLNDAHRYLQSMQEGFQQSDWLVVTRHAHTLKSSSQSIGAEKMAQLSYMVEDAANQQQQGFDYPASFEAMTAELQAVSHALHAAI